MAEIFRQIVEWACGSQTPQELKIIAMEVGPSWEATKGLQIPDQARIIVAAGVNLLYACWETLPAQGPNGTKINPEHFPIPRKLVISFDKPCTHLTYHYGWQTDSPTLAEELNENVNLAPPWATVLPFLLESKLPEVRELNDLPYLSYGRTILKILNLAGEEDDLEPKIVIHAAQIMKKIIIHIAKKEDLKPMIPAHFRVSLSISSEFKSQYHCNAMQVGSFTFHKRTPSR